jgi:hypothetical protein
MDRFRKDEISVLHTYNITSYRSVWGRGQVKNIGIIKEKNNRSREWSRARWVCLLSFHKSGTKTDRCHSFYCHNIPLEHSLDYFFKYISIIKAHFHINLYIYVLFSNYRTVQKSLNRKKLGYLRHILVKLADSFFPLIKKCS